MITTIKTGTTLLRPDHGYGFIEIPTALLEAAQKHLTTKGLGVIAGIDEFSPTDLLTYRLFREWGVTLT